MKLNLKSGDMLHYAPHKATGILINNFIREGMTYWKYILRSPKTIDSGHNLVNEFEIEAHKIIEAVEKGDLTYFTSG